MTRQHKTPAQRAEEALAVAQRAVDRLTGKQVRVTGELSRLTRELADAERRRNYLAQDPDLPTTSKENPAP